MSGCRRGKRARPPLVERGRSGDWGARQDVLKVVAEGGDWGVREDVLGCWRWLGTDVPIVVKEEWWWGTNGD